MTVAPVQTIREIVEGFAMRGAASALGGVGGSAMLSHSDLADFIRATEAELARAGVGRGDVVMLAAADGPAALSALLAIASVATVLPVPALDQEAGYERLIDELDIETVMLDDRPDARLVRIAERRALTTLRMAEAGGKSTFRVAVDRPREARPVEPPRPEDHAIIGLTSGTTAAPKIVAVSHASVHAQSHRFAELMGLTAQDRSLCVMPVSHLHSLFRSSFPVLMEGGSVIWAPGLDERRVLDWIDTLKPTFATGTPTHFRRIATRAEETGWTPVRSRLRLIALGSDRVTEGDMERTRRVFGVQVAQFYGMTETSPVIAATPLTVDAPQGAASVVNPDWEVTCLGEDGQPVPVGEVGQIAVRGGFVNPVIGQAARERVRLDPVGRFLTGDLGRLDSAGFLHVVGRIDDRITRGGEKIAPQSVEDAIDAMQPVAGSVVFGAPDPILGERVIAAVKPRSPGAVTEATILHHLGTQLQRHMLPERIILVDHLPDTRAGKMSRRSLADHFAGELSHDPVSSRRETPHSHPAPSIAAEMLEIFRRRMEDPELGFEGDFFASGGDSLTALEILMEIEERFGVSLAPAAFTVAGTAARVAMAVEEARGRPLGARVVEIQAGKPGLAVVVGHGLGGEAGYAPNLARAMRDNQTVAALHARAPDRSIAHPKNLPEMAKDYAELLCRHFPQGRLITGGFSLGAHVSLAIANRLAALGRNVPLVFVLDDEADLDKRNFGARRSPTSERTPEAINKWALDASPAEPFPGRIVYFRAEENDGVYRSDPTAGWGEIAVGGVEIVDIPGSHHVIVRKSTLERIGSTLQHIIDRTAIAGGSPNQVDEARHMRFAVRVAARDGRLDDEIALSQKVIDAFPDQPHWFHGNLAEALFQAADIPAALVAMHCAIQSDPWPLATDVRFAPLVAARGLKTEIAAMLKRADGVVRDHPSVFHHLAMLHTRLGCEEQAECFYQLGLSEAPAHLKLNFGLAAVLFRKQRFMDAARIYRAIVADYPEITLTHIQLGRSLIGAGQAETAEGVIRDALERWPRNVQLNVALASAIRECGRLQEAEEFCRRAIEMAPKAHEPREMLADILRETGRGGEVAVMMEHAGWR